MRATLAPYINDIVSLLVLALMSIALIAGEAGATDTQTERAALHDNGRALVIDIDFSFRPESD
jgi:hypothetical protein